MIARSCGTEAGGKAWDESPAMYGHISVQVDFIVNAKMHCQFPVYVWCGRGPYGGGQLCAWEQKEINPLKAGTPSTEPCTPSLPILVPSQVAAYLPPLSPALEAWHLYRSCWLLRFSHTVLKIPSSRRSQIGGSNTVAICKNALAPTQSRCCLLKWVICPQIFKGN